MLSVLRWYARLISIFMLYAMVAELWTDWQIVTNPTLSFSSSLVDGPTVEVAATNAVLLPLVLFLVYFANWGRPGTQVRVAQVAVCTSGLAPVAYTIASFSVRYPPPGNEISLELVFSAFLTWALWSGVVLGVYLRWRHIELVRIGTHPRCERCGYDLTGNVAGQCPECGESGQVPTQHFSSGL